MTEGHLGVQQLHTDILAEGFLLQCSDKYLLGSPELVLVQGQLHILQAAPSFSLAEHLTSFAAGRRRLLCCPAQQDVPLLEAVPVALVASGTCRSPPPGLVQG